MQSPPDLEPITFTDDELDDRLARVARRGAALQRRRGLARAALAGTVALVVALTAALVLATRPTSPAARSAAPAAFHLVGAVSPDWHVVGGPLEQSFALTCPAAATCYASDQGVGGPGRLRAVEVTRNGGASWSRSALPVPLSFATRLACVDETHCALVGLTDAGRSVLLSTADGGATWATHPGPNGLTSAIGVATLACTSATTCAVAVSDPGGQDGAAFSSTTTDGGATWASVALPMGFAPLWLTCPVAGACVTGGFLRQAGLGSGSPPALVLTTDDVGRSWTTTATPATLGPLDAGACASDGTCVAAFFDGSRTAVLRSADDGRTFSASTGAGLPHGAVTAVACPEATTCWAVGIGALKGRGVPILPSGGQPAPRGSTTLWLAGSGHGFAAVSPDQGQTWQPATLPSQVAAVLDVSCPSATACYALAAVPPAPGESGGLTIELLASTSASAAA